MKQITKITALFFCTSLVFWHCKTDTNTQKPQKSVVEVSGKTMGTTYHLTYTHPEKKDFKSNVDSILNQINAEVNTYDPNSLISRFNASETGVELTGNDALAGSAHFHFNYSRSESIMAMTDSFFDPTVMPLVRYWGFAKERRPVTEVDSQKVNELRSYLGMDQIVLHKEGSKLSLHKKNPKVELDFSAIAKGYAVDQLVAFLEAHSIEDYFVEIGGEVRVNGQSPRSGDSWTVGINVPDPDAGPTDITQIVKIHTGALASSGNYRNFHKVDGRLYGHTINPKTGYPEINELLSASVFAGDCTTADALATACMAAGLERAASFIEAIDGVEAFFIYGTPSGKMDVQYTPGFASLLK